MTTATIRTFRRSTALAFLTTTARTAARVCLAIGLSFALLANVTLAQELDSSIAPPAIVQPPKPPKMCYDPGSPGTPDTVIPGSPGMPDTVIPGSPGTPSSTYPCPK